MDDSFCAKKREETRSAFRVLLAHHAKERDRYFKKNATAREFRVLFAYATIRCFRIIQHWA